MVVNKPEELIAVKIQIQKNEFNSYLNIVEKALPIRSTIPAINNILLQSDNKKLTLTATNLELAIKVTIPFEGEAGAILLPSKIVDIVRYLPETDASLDLNWETFRINIESGPSNFLLNGSDPADYPLIEEISLPEGAFKIKTSTLKQVLREVVFVASTEESRPAFNGVLFEFKENGITLTASDTYRLVIREITGYSFSFEKQRYLIPAKSLRELMKVLDEDAEYVSIFPDREQLVFYFNNIHFMTRVLNEKYPDVRGVIPKQYQTRIKVERKPLEETISRATLLAEGINQVIQLEIADQLIKVKVSSQLGSMEETLPTAQEGDPLAIYVNSRFILDILKVVEEKELFIDLHGKEGPIIFRIPDDENFLYLVLPIKMG
jgi:DNA polymerase-3 subunit beta